MSLTPHAPAHRWPAHLAQALPTAAALAMLAWVGRHHVEHSAMAVLLLLLIAAVFLAGAWNLHRYRRDSQALDTQLQQTQATPDDISIWLARLLSSLMDFSMRAVAMSRWVAM